MMYTNEKYTEVIIEITTIETIISDFVAFIAILVNLRAPETLSVYNGSFLDGTFPN